VPAVPETKATWTNAVDALSSTNLHAYLRDPLRFLMRKPAAVLRSTATQSIPNNAFTSVTLNVEDLDDDPDGIGGHSTSVNTSRYTARYPGWYLCSGGVTWAGSATGRRGGRWAVNGSAVNGSAALLVAGIAAAASTYPRTMSIFLDEGDFVEMQVFQDSGGALSTLNSAGDQSMMSVTWDRLEAP
jgi:hypothetical protein